MHTILDWKPKHIFYEIYINTFTLLSHSYYYGRYVIEIFIVIDNNDNIYVYKK